MSNQKLLPCPFCGCTKVPKRQGNGIGDYWLECFDCGASTRLREDGADNEKDWNRRPDCASTAMPVVHGTAEHEPTVAETALSDAYYFVTGKSPAWSETFTRGDAVEEIKQSVNILRRRAMPDDIANVITRLEKLVTWEPGALSSESAAKRLETINTLLYNVLTGSEDDPLRWPHAITLAEVRSLIADHRRDGIRQVRGFGLTASGGYLIRVADTLQWCVEQIDTLPRASDAARFTQADMERYGKAYADACDKRRAVVSQELTTQQGDERAGLTFEQWIESIPPLTWDGWGRREAAHAAWLHATASHATKDDEREQWTSAYEKGFADGWSKGPYGSKPATQAAKSDAPTGFFDVVFDGHLFVEVEDEQGRSFNAGEWIDRGDGLWALRIARTAPQAERCVSEARSPFADDNERTLFIQTMEEFEDCNETATDDRLLMKWACAGLLECNSYLITEKGQDAFDAARAASSTAEIERKGVGDAG